MAFCNYPGIMVRIMCVHNEKYFTNHVEKLKDVECEEEIKDVS